MANVSEVLTLGIGPPTGTTLQAFLTAGLQIGDAVIVPKDKFTFRQVVQQSLSVSQTASQQITLRQELANS